MHKILSVCCQFIATHNYQFWVMYLISKMALTFLRVSIVFTISSFVSSSQIAVTSSSRMSGPQFTRPQSTGLSGLGAMLSLITGSN